MLLNTVAQLKQLLDFRDLIILIWMHRPDFSLYLLDNKTCTTKSATNSVNNQKLQFTIYMPFQAYVFKNENCHKFWPLDLTLLNKRFLECKTWKLWLMLKTFWTKRSKRTKRKKKAGFSKDIELHSGCVWIFFAAN